MARICAVAVAVASLASLVTSAFAEDASRGLNQFSTVQLIVETPDEDARRCGITEASLDAAMRLPISATKLAITKAYAPILHISTTAIALPNGMCAIAVRMAYSRPFWPYRGDTGPMVWAESWQHLDLLTGSPATIGKRVADSAEGATKVFLAAWLKEQ